MEILCPLCAEPLVKTEHTYLCPNRHSFDLARQGYVNLLPVQQKRSLHPGDTRQQVLSRREFLDGGFYAPIAQALVALAKKHGAAGPVLDVGCGEGYYSELLAQSLQAELTGLDISKEAVRCAAGRYKNALWLCASAARLPVGDNSVGVLTSLFALTVAEEFHRVLRPDGIYIQAVAAADHLLGLKRIVYPTLTHKEKDPAPSLPGFILAESLPVRFEFSLEGQQVQNLLAMTPHVYRIGAEGARRLAETTALKDTASCILRVYRPV